MALKWKKDEPEIVSCSTGDWLSSQCGECGYHNRVSLNTSATTCYGCGRKHDYKSAQAQAAKMLKDLGGK